MCCEHVDTSCILLCKAEPGKCSRSTKVMMSTFAGEETYLEAFVEQFTSSQFTYQLRRTLDLLRDMDATGQAEGRAAQELSHEFLGHVERKIRQTLQVVISSNEGDGEGPERKRPRRGVRVISSEDTVATEDLPMIPTTEELLEYILQEEHHNTTYTRILELQQSCRQKAEEKVQIAQQAYELVDAQVQRLDHDLRSMEQLLQVRVCWLMYLILYSMVHACPFFSPREIFPLDRAWPWPPNPTTWPPVK
jgi:Inhibitor of growth proteins N-terminal histone-binding